MIDFFSENKITHKPAAEKATTSQANTSSNCLNKNATETQEVKLELVPLGQQDTSDKKGQEDQADAFSDDGGPPRETWSKKLDFLMSIIGFSVDLASVWRL